MKVGLSPRVFVVVQYLTSCYYIDPITHALTLLGKLPVAGSAESADAVVRIEKTALSADTAGDFLTKSLESSRLIEGTDIVRPLRPASNVKRC